MSRLRDASGVGYVGALRDVAISDTLKSVTQSDDIGRGENSEGGRAPEAPRAAASAPPARTRLPSAENPTPTDADAARAHGASIVDGSATLTADAAGMLWELFICPECAYPLRGIASERCPECGHEIGPLRRGEALLPWTKRRERGAWRAYWQTVGFVTRRPRAFASEIARPVDLPAARAFVRATLGMILLGWGLVLAANLIVQPQAFIGGLIWLGLPLVIGIALGFVCWQWWCLTLVPIAFRFGRLSPVLEARTFVLALYLVAPWGYCPLVALFGILTEITIRYFAFKPSLVRKDEFIPLGIGVLFFSALLGFIWWLRLIGFAIRRVPGIGALLAVAIGLPAAWLLAAIVLIGGSALVLLTGMLAWESLSRLR